MGAGLLRNLSWLSRQLRKREPEFGCLLLQTGNLSFALALVIRVGPDIMKGCSMLEHEVKDARQLVGSSDNRLLGAMLGSHTPEVGSQSGLGAAHGLGSNPKGLTRPVMCFEKVTTEDLTT